MLQELIKYSDDIITGKINACKKHKSACKRFLLDIEREGTDAFPYVWNEEKALKIVKWFSYLRHSKGILAKQPIILTTWQKFILCNIYGWYHKDTGYRRFKKAFIEVARKNAKSQIMAGVALYEISAFGVNASEAYCLGTKMKQSKIVFNEAKLMLKSSPLQKKFKITRDEIRHVKSDSFIRPLSKEDGKTGDGENPQFACIDEYHQHPTDEMYSVMATGMKARPEPLLMIITTAGKDLTYPAYTQEYQYCSNVLNGSIENNTYFVMICELDKEDEEDLSNEENWKKANPIVMYNPIGIQSMRDDYKIACDISEKMTDFMTKNLNIWVQKTNTGYMDMEKWKLCEVDQLPFDLSGRDVYVGVDLSAKIDLSSVAFLFPIDDEEEERKYVLLSHSFIPRGRLQERIRVDKQPYDLWQRQKFLTVTDSEIVNQKDIIKYIVDTCEENNWNINMICVDPNNASLFMQEMSDKGYIVVDVWQSAKSLNDATTGFREQVYLKNVVYLKNPLLTFAMANTRIRKNNGLIKIDKDAQKQRIDPIDATLCAYKLAMFHKSSVDLSDLITEEYLSKLGWG
ncbi:terminase large subunit [Desulfitobacterium hafniense]